MRAWLGTLTHHRSVDFVRREEASRRRAERDTELAPAIDIEEMATSLAVAERVRIAVDAPPEDQRRAVRLAYYGGGPHPPGGGEAGGSGGAGEGRARPG